MCRAIKAAVFAIALVAVPQEWRGAECDTCFGDGILHDFVPAVKVWNWFGGVLEPCACPTCGGCGQLRHTIGKYEYQTEKKPEPAEEAF
mgnify:CR=1 FL=1